MQQCFRKEDIIGAEAELWAEVARVGAEARRQLSES
jgi:hypothetical protein